MLNITRIAAFADNYLWLLHAGNERKVAVVDPGDAAPVIAAIEDKGWHLSTILVTHHHGDHCGGVAELKARYGAVVYGPALEAIAGVDHALNGDEAMDIAYLGAVQVMNLPGHTRGHIAYRIGPHLFSGDVLFGGGCGRLFEGTAAQMWQSLQQIMELPDDTQIYCAHEYTLSNLRFALSIEPDSTELLAHQAAMVQRRANNLATVPLNLAREKQINPFLRCADPTLQRRLAALTLAPLNDALACFTLLRRLKDQFSA